MDATDFSFYPFEDIGQDPSAEEPRHSTPAACDGDVVGDLPFYAPVSADMIDGLMGAYQKAHARICQIAEVLNGEENARAVAYFLEGNMRDQRYTPGVGRLFNLEGAINALTAEYWAKTIKLTDVYDLMPQARRDAWNTQLTAWKEDRYERGKNPEVDMAPFEEATVRDTIQTLLAMRAQFFGERVDGIFRTLSGEHVTNAPQGFGKRMIIARVLDEWKSVNYGRCGYINDLRCVIAKFMGRDEPRWNTTSRVIESLKHRWGEWVEIDGGAIRIRLYRKGTAHLEVHPDMAWRLNAVLASMYPLAIPPEFRQRPKKAAKQFKILSRPLPFAVVELLGELRRTGNTNSFHLPMGRLNEPAYKEMVSVLQAIGGAVQKARALVDFDYDPRKILDEIVAMGCIPDQASHQFYPTPATVAEEAIAAADIGEEDNCLEPSAGQGGLAEFMPRERTQCVELSRLHCDILRAKGYAVECDDFVEWAQRCTTRYSRIVMNPPFSGGRWTQHLQMAAGLLADNGRLVAILPASARHADVLPGWGLEWSRNLDNEFAGTSISVVILCAEPPAR